MKRFLIGSLALATVSVSVGQVIDGTKDALYGGGNFQTSPTGFGDNNVATALGGGGSELNALYAEITGTHLYLMFTGNLERGGNRLDIFIDNNSGSGQSTVSSTGNRVANLNGLTFDSAFKATNFVTLNATNDGTFFVDTASFSGSSWTQTYRGSGAYSLTGNGALSGGSNAGDLYQVAVNNSNLGGVTTTSAANAALATTGIELAIKLSDLGFTGTDAAENWGRGVKVSAFINGGGGDFLSNQVLGGIPAGGNLGNPNGLDFNSITGNQFVAVPEPASMAALGLGLLGLARRRRNK